MGDYANFMCDLHGHTTRSDGNDTPLEFLEHARERGMKIVAITDHDKVPPDAVTVEDRELEIVSFAGRMGIILLKGIEISCETNIEDVHLVCFGCDWKSDFFKALDQFTVKSKTDSYRELIERLSQKGIRLSWDEILYNHGDPVTEENIQKKMIFNMIAEKGYTRDWSEAKLLVKQDSTLSVAREKPEAADIIHEIHRQGGIVIQAHPYLVAEQVCYEGREMNRRELMDHFVYEGIDGFEARYTYDKTSYSGKLTKEEIYSEIIGAYKDRVPVISGGSDYHADGKKGIKNPRDIGECGITESEFYQNPILAKLVSL